MIIDDVESINESVFYGSDIVLLCTNGDIDIERSNTFSRFARKIFSIQENQNYVGFEGYNLMILNNSGNFFSIVNTLFCLKVYTSQIFLKSTDTYHGTPATQCKAPSGHPKKYNDPLRGHHEVKPQGIK